MKLGWGFQRKQIHLHDKDLVKGREKFEGLANNTELDSLQSHVHK